MIRQPPASLVKYETNPWYAAGPPADPEARRSLLDRAKEEWQKAHAAMVEAQERADFDQAVDERRRNLAVNREANRQDRREQLKALGESGWGFRDLRAAHAALDGKAQQPEIGQWGRTLSKDEAAEFGDTEGDGHGILYSRKVNLIFGSSESGKSLFSFSIAAQEIRAGKHVLIIDFEDDVMGFVSRLTDLGLDIEEIDPDGIRPGGAHYIQARLGMEEDDFQLIRGLVDQYGDKLSFVLIDAVTEAMAADGLNPDKAAEVAQWAANVPKRIAALGPGVAIIDHTNLTDTDRAQGSQHKKSMVDGVSLQVKRTNAFIRKRGGAASIYVAKDRIGSVREQAVSAEAGKLEYRGKFAVNVGESAEQWGAFSMIGRNPLDLDRVPDADDADARTLDVDEVMEEAVRVVTEHPGIGKKAAMERITVPAANNKKFAALEEAARLGLIEFRPAARGKIECYPKARPGQLSMADLTRPDLGRNGPTYPHDQDRSRSTYPHDQDRSGQVNPENST